MTSLHGDSRIETAHIPRVAAKYRNAPPGTKQCRDCQMYRPATAEHWISKGGIGNWAQPCKPCRTAKGSTHAH